MDRIRTTLFTPDAVREMVTLLNQDIRARAEHRGSDLDRARAQVRRLEQQDANLRRALRTAGPSATERITLEIETLGVELEAATARLNDLQLTERPIRITKKLVDETIAQFEGILERASPRDEGRDRQGPVRTRGRLQPEAEGRGSLEHDDRSGR